MAKTPFLADLHSRFGLPRSQVAGLAAQATGHDVETIERLARGYDNEVHRVTLTGELVVYVRIRRYGEGTQEQEAWAMDLARAGGVAVPDVLLVDAASENADGHPVMVVAAARGQQLEEVLAAVTDQQRHQLLSNVGHELARLHSIDMPGVWRPDHDGQWPDPVELRAGFAAKRRGEADQLTAAGMTSAEVNRMMALLEVSPDPPGTGFVLCHGDVSSEHIFVDSTLQVSGLIDWGMWHAGSRTGELAGVANSFGWNNLQPILQGYGHGLPSNGDTLLRQLATTLAVQLIGHIAHDVAIEDSDGAASNVAAVRQALRVLDDTGPS
ncbi:phosphotransferase family protein [Auraticoccus monumenti]|uniref:phosphotransferase family protein n=1 Tax=Auraticoccus monumenti TaxID=675864 RepID=UPI0012FBF37B|nr:aminoglycoside phosphotransferase family protein [Auraticoccus monumenti]